MRFHIIAAISAAGVAAPLQAGVIADDLSRCLVTKATDSDHHAFMAWMFSAISADPRLQQFSTLDRAKRDQIGKAAAGVFQRLLLVDCRKETVASLKAEGTSATFGTFNQLGQAAARQMFQSPQVDAELETLGKNFDEGKLSALGAEAGIRIRNDEKD
ncbi:MAG TPA: hypothetical protein VIL42_01445 [Sphingomicrobium sp.]|jgi:hypothetical protein